MKPLHEYLSQLMRLHLLIVEDNDNEEADELRDQMDISGSKLSPDEIKEARRWSAFMYEFDNWKTANPKV